MVQWIYNHLSYLVVVAVHTFLTILPWQFFISGGAVVFLTVSLHRLQCLRFTHSYPAFFLFSYMYTSIFHLFWGGRVL